MITSLHLYCNIPKLFSQYFEGLRQGEIIRQPGASQIGDHFHNFHDL